MKRNTHHSRKSPKLPFAWREEEYAALLVKAADCFDDRVSGILFDAEDERAEVDIIVHRLNHDAS